MPKFFGLFSNKGLTTFLASCFLATEGAGATFFPLAFFPLGCKIQETQLDEHHESKKAISEIQHEYLTAQIQQHASA